MTPLIAAEHRGIVTFGGLALPGASITVENGSVTLTAITDVNGAYGFPDLPEGTVKVRVEMQLFEPLQREITTGGPPVPWEMKLLPEEKLSALATTAAPAPVQEALAPAPVSSKRPLPAATNTRSPFQRTEVAAAKGAAPAPQAAPAPDPETAQRAADGLLINGSVNNAATSPFATLPAFGNFRRGQRSLYNGSLGLIMNHSVFDARSYSITGQDTPKPEYSRLQGLFSFGGPLKIPKLLTRNGPMVTINYQWTRNTNASTQSGLVPTALERAGDFSTAPRAPVDPATGVPFPGGIVPPSRFSPEAQALLNLFPLPNFTGSSNYNFQTPIVAGMHQDDLQLRVNKPHRRNFYSGTFNLQSTRTSNPNLFGFLDTGRTLGLTTGFNYRRSIKPRFFVNLGVQYSRQNDRLIPFFSERRNIAAEAGIGGTNTEPVNWGPPALSFVSGLTTLSDAQFSYTRNQTASFSADSFYNRGRHNITFGVTHRRQQFNVLSQQDPRGSFAFNGVTTGNDVAGFLLGIPDTSSIAYGNADKYLRATINEAFVNDDFRVNPGFTLNYGLRWEYWTPIEEKYGRLVNLDIANGFSAVTPSIGGGMKPDRNNFAPRVGFSWRPLPASSMVVRGGYGVYYDTSVYQPIAMRMAQQAPLSKSLRVSNSEETPLTLANGFPPASSATEATTFGVDPYFRIGYAHNWQVSVQRDLPWGLQVTGTYLGAKGTRSQQQLLPNTFPSSALDPTGYTYLASNGNSIRHAGQLQVRRRLRSGFTAEATYTYAKSIDNAALGGRNQGATLTAQNWLDLSGERGRSNFDQRHVLSGTVQYTTGMGLKGGTLATGWKSRYMAGWTFGSMVSAGTGTPLSPVYPIAVSGTGVIGVVRPNYTGASLYEPPPGLHLNPAALSAPSPGQWGNAGRNSINGPNQFALNASVGRTFRGTERFSFDLRVDANNVLNSVRFPSWNTVYGNAQFGLPVMANPMRTIQATVRSRF